MKKLYSYVLRYDDGGAPNPFWGTCTLAICKPDIRRKATVGDWIIGTGSKNSKLKDGNIYDLSNSLVYAMKVTKKLTMCEYDKFCQKNLHKKIPKWYHKSFQMRMGDCIYDYTNPSLLVQRKGVHNEGNIKRDLRGVFVLLSKHFYYFGEEPRPIPLGLKHIIRRGQKHLVFEDNETITKFESWISQYIKNKIYGDPQLKFEFDVLAPDLHLSMCAERHLKGSC